ncbi:MAG TPA: PAS domain-containing protein [Lacunisphaera sp.]|nr:PAS domain-containing protein [Lacunisphaera sp.]
MPPDFSSPAGAPAAPATGSEALWSAEVLRAIFNQAPFLTGILSPEGRILEAGRLALGERGYTPEEVRGLFFWDAPTWRGLDEVQARLRAAFADVKNGRSFQAVLPFRAADGSAHWTELTLSPLTGADGRLLQIIALGHDVTARVRAEQNLSVVQGRLDSALMAADIATYDWDVLADRLFADRNLARLFGITLDAEGAAPLADFMAVIDAGDRERVLAEVRRSIETGCAFEQDYRINPSGGTPHWVNSRGRMITDAAGRVIRFVGVVTDITRYKQAEREREEIADRLRRLTAIHETVLSSINDFAYVWDLDGRFLYANRPLLKLYGRTLDQVVGKTFSELGYPAWHAQMHLREIAQVVATRQPYQGEVFFRGESGESGVFDYIFVPVFGTDGRVEAVAGTTRDVTAHKRTEARDRLLVALDDAMRPLTDPAEITQAGARLLGEHLSVNRCAYADVEDDQNTFNLTGDFNREVPSIVGRYRFDQFGEDCLRLMREGRPYVVSDTETDPRVGNVRQAYRDTLIRSVICVPLHKAGRFVAAMAVHQTTVREWQPSDVEVVLAVANRCWESIERARIVRVLAASEQRLTQAVAELGRASRAKDDFLATLSHELRTPLNPVLLLASELARDASLAPEVRASFEMIRKNVELEARLIDDLLDLTSIVRGKLTVRKEVRELDAILADAIAAVRPEFELRGVILTEPMAPSGVRVFADEVRLAQVFINLLKNAAKFTPRGGTVTVVTVAEGSSVAVRITDSGIGMTSAELARVFDAFEQGDHAGDVTQQRFGGLGLGLAIAQRLVQAHGGEITGMSGGRGRGSSFTVKLPVHVGATAATAGVASGFAAPKSACHRGRRILLVEDHEATRQALEKILRQRQFEVVSAGSVGEARQLAAEGKFDLVLSDIGLADGDGAVLMRELRDVHGLKGIALTGYGMEEDIERYRVSGFVSHLTKPIRTEALDALLAEALS